MPEPVSSLPPPPPPPPRPPPPLPPSLQPSLRSQTLAALLQESDVPVRALLAESFHHIALADYPHAWPTALGPSLPPSLPPAIPLALLPICPIHFSLSPLPPSLPPS